MFNRWALCVLAFAAACSDPVDPSPLTTFELPDAQVAVPISFTSTVPSVAAPGTRITIDSTGGPAHAYGRVIVSNGSIATGSGYCIPSLQGACLDITLGTKRGSIDFRFDAAGEGTTQINVPGNLPEGTYVGQVVAFEPINGTYAGSSPWSITIERCTTSDDCDPSDFCDVFSRECLPRVPNGDACLIDDVCQSGICDGLACRACTALPQEGCDFDTEYCEFGACLPQGDVGESCGFADQCLSGICNVVTGTCGDCDEESDCASSDYCDFTLNTCLPRVANGSVCVEDRVCASGICDGLTCVECTALPPDGCDFGTEYCEAAQCQPRGTVGDACSLPDQCINDLCNVFTGTCGDCAVNSVCDSDEFCDLGTSLCTDKLPNGSACAADDAACESGICDAVVCVECTALPQEGCDFSSEFCAAGACNPLGGVGASCAFGNQCSSGICNLPTLQCGECDANSDCASNEFCDLGLNMCADKLPNGSACANDDGACQSGMCDVAVCVECTAAPAVGCDFSSEFCALGACNPVGGFGASCAFGNQCSSGICNLPTLQCGDCDANGDCASDEFCDLAVNVCKDKLPNGSACANDDDACSSGICDGVVCVECTAAPQEGCDFSSEFCSLGECEPLGGFGASCLAGSQCASGICNLVGQYCGNCATNGDCASSEHCDVLSSTCVPDGDIGDVCAVDADCASDICDLFFCVECANSDDCGSWSNCSFGTCNPFGQPGSACVLNSDCQSNFCNPNDIFNPFDATCD